MKKLTGKVMAIIFLYIVFSFCWNLIKFNTVPEPLSQLLTVLLGPAVILSIVLGATLKYLWRIPGANGLLQTFIGSNPILAGTWEGSIKWEEEMQGKKIERSKPAYLSIFQPDAFSLHCWFFTDERKSRSNIAVFEFDGGIGTLTYTYASDEAIKKKVENPSHTGVAVLRLENARGPLSLGGYYCTDRKTAGSISLKRKSMRYSHSFSEACRNCGRIAID